MYKYIKRFDRQLTWIYMAGQGSTNTYLIFKCFLSIYWQVEGNQLTKFKELLIFALCTWYEALTLDKSATVRKNCP